MDVDKDGRIYKKDLYNFAEEVLSKLVKVLKENKQTHLIDQQVRAYCALKLWRDIYSQDSLSERNFDNKTINED